MTTSTLIVPSVLPSMERVAAAVSKAVQTYLSDCLAAVEAQAEAALRPVLTLTKPTKVRTTYIRDDEVNLQWPVLVVQTLGPRRNDPPSQAGGFGASVVQNPAVGRWRGTLWLQYWVTGQDREALEATLMRVQAALWLMLVNADAARELAGATLDAGTAVMGATGDIETAESVNLRVAQVEVDVLLGV